MIRLLNENTSPTLSFRNRQARVRLGKYTIDFESLNSVLEIRVTRISRRTVIYRIPSYRVDSYAGYRDLADEIWNELYSYGEDISDRDIRSILSQYDAEVY